MKSPEPETDNELRFISSVTRNIEPTTRETLSGLRMRENITTTPHEATARTEAETANRPETPTEEDPGSADDTAPPCRGLIDRTEAGWKRCMERFAGAGSKLISSRETTTGAFKETGELEKGHASVHDDKPPDDDDEYEHFYYFDGVLKRVRNNFYPHNRSERRRGKGSHDTSERSVRKKGENLLSYIQRLNLRNKFSHFSEQDETEAKSK
ncbi:hypothetical protein INR49_030716 [Caranx melampygus]|nr:hypothetical protein INR49_030716 [Caranx melampygus]